MGSFRSWEFSTSAFFLSTKTKQEIFECTRQSGASISGYQMPMGFCQSEIQRTFQKHHAIIYIIFARKPFQSTEKTSGYGMTREKCVRRAKTPKNTKKELVMSSKQSRNTKKLSKNHHASAKSLFFRASLI